MGSNDAIPQALQACTTFLKELDRRASATPSVDPEFTENLKLSKLTISKAKTKIENAARMGSGSTLSPSTSVSSSVLASAAAEAATTSTNYSFLYSAPLWSVILSGFYWKKKRMSELALSTLHVLLQCPQVDLDLYTVLFISPTSPRSSGAASSASSAARTLCSVGEAIFIVLAEFLSSSPEPSLQTRIFQMLHWLISGIGQRMFTGKCVTRTIHSIFTVALQTSQESLRVSSQDLLQLCVLRVTRGFVLASRTSPARPITFATNTPLDDYTTDVEGDAQFFRLNIITTDTEEVSLISTGPPEYESLNTSLDPHAFFRSSLDDTTVRNAVRVLQSEERLPQPLKDLLILLKNTCKLATRPCSGSPTDGNPDVRARQLALKMLERVFEELPVSNCETEHRCATWVGLVLSACKYDLLRCLVQNIATIQPFSFFESGIHLLTALLRKCHYHLSRELHTLLSVFLLPLAGSKYCDFRQKHAVLSMLMDLMSVPHLIISFFINYDCNPAFDAGGTHGGMVELIIDFMTELMYLDHVSEDVGEDWLTCDQQQLLRSECIVAIHAYIASLHRWISEDPKSYAKHLAEKQQRAREARGAFARDDAYAKEWAEIYLDSWDAMESPTNATIAKPGSEGRGAPWAKMGKNIQYHWKHIHYLLQNKRIAQEAVGLINEKKWLEAKAFLESRRYLPTREVSAAEAAWEDVPGGTSSYADFARFLFEYPGISRDAISGIFDRINKPKNPSKYVLRDYFHLFRYDSVPIDVALRDSTCKFMSWDRPMFEAQVWETIQTTFGEEYARQNTQSITAKDADTMAGVLLFLHANLHNESAKNSRMKVESFISDGNACLDFPLEESYMRAMYKRTLLSKWQLDDLGRTPREAEQAAGLAPVSAHIMREWQSAIDSASQAQQNSSLSVHTSSRFQSTQPPPTGQAFSPMLSNMTGEDESSFLAATVLATSSATLNGVKDSDSNIIEREVEAFERGVALVDTAPLPDNMAEGSECTTATPTMSSPLSAQQFATARADVTLLDATPPSYCDAKDNLKLREDHHIAFKEVAAVRLARLESEHKRFYADRSVYRPQPYVVPHYAEHVRPLLLATYAQVMACLYMGLRVLEEATLSNPILNTFQVTYDIAAAFVVNLGDLRPAVLHTIQRYLTDDKAYRLLPSSRATFVPFILNSI